MSHNNETFVEKHYKITNDEISHTLI